MLIKNPVAETARYQKMKIFVMTSKVIPAKAGIQINSSGFQGNSGFRIKCGMTDEEYHEDTLQQDYREYQV